MRVNRNLYLVFGILLINTAIAIGSTLSGIVRDSQTKESLPGASVAIDKSPFGAFADSDGYFVIGNVPSEIFPITLRVHLIGYKDKIIELSQFPRNDIEIYLEQSSWKMEDMV
ncbi:MAG: carboxypeptidase-like regulatory domain-containing protein, partial [candidate division Zixibacteria bacterium]|nr:carboxypeptidase-like regulatory domain-containing protein [candidate division Zixibacteria bacterium]